MSKQSNGIIFDRYRKMVSDSENPLMKGCYFDGYIYVATHSVGFRLRSSSLPDDIFIAPNGMGNDHIYKLIEKQKVGGDELPLPTESMLKGYIKANKLTRKFSEHAQNNKSWVQACRYDIDGINGVNVFYLLDAITLIPDGKLYGDRKKQWFTWRGETHRRYTPVKLQNDDGEYAVIMPIKETTTSIYPH